VELCGEHRETQKDQWKARDEGDRGEGDAGTDEAHAGDHFRDPPGLAACDRPRQLARHIADVDVLRPVAGHWNSMPRMLPHGAG
jgi:hypothetical protein